LGESPSESQVKEVDAQEQKNEERDCAYQDDCAASFAEVGVGRLEATVLDPPANRHHRDGVFEEDKANESGEALFGVAKTMSVPEFDPAKKYDVAISFLVQDLALAQALYDKLAEGLRVFFFPRNQEELAGTDGPESMRAPFRNESLLNVVLYREKWGNTPWTAVEAAAVKNSCLATGFKSLFFFIVEPSTALPGWLPETHVRFNYRDFSLEEAVGAIKLRVQERGGHFTPLTPAKRAEVLKAEDEYRFNKSSMNSQRGLELIQKKLFGLFKEIERQCTIINEQGHLTIKCEINFIDRGSYQTCILTDIRSE
jgi:hypothetical protein